MITEILKNRFYQNMTRHPDLEWDFVEARLNENKEALEVLRRMEESGGEPDTIGIDETSGKIIFCDCSSETPAGRRSLCYDDEALEKRKKNPPAGSAMHQSREMGVSMLTEELYRRLQELGPFDQKTSSWIATPDDVRSKVHFSQWRGFILFRARMERLYNSLINSSLRRQNYESDCDIRTGWTGKTDLY